MRTAQEQDKKITYHVLLEPMFVSMHLSANGGLDLDDGIRGYVTRLLDTLPILLVELAWRTQPQKHRQRAPYPVLRTCRTILPIVFALYCGYGDQLDAS